MLRRLVPVTLALGLCLNRHRRIARIRMVEWLPRPELVRDARLGAPRGRPDREQGSTREAAGWIAWALEGCHLWSSTTFAEEVDGPVTLR